MTGRAALAAWGIVSLCAAGATALAAERPGAVIRGVVLEEGTDRPIPGAWIMLDAFGTPERPYWINTPPVAPAATTDRDGRFTVGDIGPGAYTLHAMSNGYARRVYGQRVERGSIPPLKVAAGQEQDLVIRLTPAGSVSGTIRGVTGRPAAGADVRLIRRTYDASGDRLLTTVTTTTADDRGEYRFYWITPGRYYVQAGDERTVDWHTPIEHFDMAARSSSNVVKGDHAATYYPGVREIESAVAVDVRPRSELAGIDVTLEPGKRFSIGGHLLDGRRHSSVLEGRIYLHDAASQYSFGGFSFEGDTYRIDSVRPGVYRIGFSTDEENAAVGSVTVAVIDSDVDVDVTLRPPAAIKGRIVVEGKLASAKLEDFSFTARPVGDVAVSGLFEDVFYARARSRADGTFTLNGLGNTELRLVPHDLPSGFYLEAGRLDGVDVLNAAAPFSRASTLEVVVSSRGGRIEGTVTDGRSSPSADAQVVLVPDARRNRPELFKSAASDDAGRFSITGIAPGDYTLIAWEALELYAWFDPDVLNRFESMGQRIHVAESSSLNIDVHAIPQQASR